ncbi:REGULATOR OF VPS4 ACTIVITY IN THE MVB PATHWAY PROTEIN [Salix purpurea]|uniref:REGULATOR OF VPS4 ACTIVITY IN THE MVB PATHWAY PROTEIN n=1 Tax=Salix purpurea TaxID=77065 RepID=A0A9Q0WP28_SALPP|nr:REGULATOR OF VPS4 ACTIVITY IN THE MVB PATHWAY PROTEIN [Salix purpurea]
MALWLNMLFHHSISFCSAWQCLPIDVSQAISNLIIFAASRCGDLPGLHMLRSLFKIRDGSKFETTNVESLPGNLVDSEMKENLSVNSVPGDVKLWLINRIAYESSTDRLGRIQSRNKKNEVLIRNLEASATSISSYGILPIHQTSVIYLDDMEVKSLSQSHSSIKKAPRSVVESCNGSASPSSVSNETKRPAKPRLGKKPVPHPSSNDHYQISVKGRSSLDSLIDECKAQSGSSSSSSHVHPKLPNYEDVVAKYYKSLVPSTNVIE